MSKKKKRPQRHVPQRTCVVCRTKRDKRDLTRIVNAPDEGVLADPTGKRNGRGAYVCDQSACWEKIVRSTVLDSALKTQVSPEEKRRLAEFGASRRARTVL